MICSDMPADEAALWQAYMADRSHKNRNRLVQRYMFLVEQESGVQAARFPRSIQRDDLRSSGHMGLLEAVEHFEPERGFKFVTYALRRIHGHVMDDLRNTDPVSRITRRRLKQVERVMDLWLSLHGQPPTTEELKAELQKRYPKDPHLPRHTPEMLSLNRAVSSQKEDVTSYKEHRLLDDLLVMPAELYGDNFFERALRGLTEVERWAVTVRFKEDWTMKRIGQNWWPKPVSESRVSQLFPRLLLRIGQNLRQSCGDLGRIRIPICQRPGCGEVATEFGLCPWHRKQQRDQARAELASKMETASPTGDPDARDRVLSTGMPSSCEVCVA